MNQYEGILKGLLDEQWPTAQYRRQVIKRFLRYMIDRGEDGMTIREVYQKAKRCQHSMKSPVKS